MFVQVGWDSAAAPDVWLPSIAYAMSDPVSWD